MSGMSKDTLGSLALASLVRREVATMACVLLGLLLALAL